MQEPLLSSHPSDDANIEPTKPTPLQPPTTKVHRPPSRLKPLTAGQLRQRRKVVQDGSLGQKLNLLRDRRKRFKAIHSPPQTGVIVGFLFVVGALILFYAFILPKPHS